MYNDYNLPVVKTDDIFTNSYEFDSKYTRPRKHKNIKENRILYENAKELVNDIDFKKDDRVIAFLNGSFIFGDFIEAFFVENNIKTKEIYVASLSFSHENVESFRNLFDGDYIDSLKMYISDYFYSHERWKTIKYFYSRLEDYEFELIVLRQHLKMVAFETESGSKVVISGSANLRSSNSIEQITIEHNNDIYDFYIEMLSSFNKYTTRAK